MAPVQSVISLLTLVSLSGSSEPELDQRKRMGAQAIAVLSVLFTMSIWLKRFKWASVKSRKLTYAPPKGH